MAETLQTLKITDHGTYRAQLVEVGQEAPCHIAEALAAGEEPVVPIRLYMPLSDARRFGAMMFEWMELKASTACLATDIPTGRNCGNSKPGAREG